MTEWTKECGVLYSQEINHLLSNGDNYEDYCSIINGIKVISNFFATIKGYVVSLTLPNNIDIIGNSGLEDCDFLFEIIISDSVKSIGDYAFAGCNHLYKINLTRNVADIGNGVFSGCDQLNNIMIPIGTKLQFEALLPDYKDKLIEQENGWTVKGTRNFNAEEIALVARAEVVPSPDGRSVCFFMMSGGRTYIPLIENSKLTVGDTLDLSKAKLVTLQKENREITRIMEISTSNSDEIHNVEGQQLYKKDNNHFHFLDSRQYELSEIKPDAELITRYLNNNSQKHLYHFTHRDNLEQIKEMGGLFSWVQLDKMGKPCQRPGGNSLSRELDIKNGVADYVHLSFSHDHPMSYRKEDIVVLYIHPIVCLLPETLFCNMNATDKNHIKGASYRDLVNINLWTPKMGYLNSGTRLFKEKQAEVLVKEHIPLEYIVNINLV